MDEYEPDPELVATMARETTLPHEWWRDQLREAMIYMANMRRQPQNADLMLEDLAHMSAAARVTPLALLQTYDLQRKL